MQAIEFLARHTGKNEKTHRELDQFFSAVGYPGKKTSQVPWCAAAAGWACIQAGYEDVISAIPREHRLMARAWDVHEAKLARRGVRRIGGQEAITNGLAQPGDIVTYTRSNTSRDRSKLVSGHIDFFTSYDAAKQRVYGLGGNESNMVRNGSSKLSRVLSVYRLPARTIEHDPNEFGAKIDKLAPLLPLLKAHEGGYSNHSDDPATNLGITIHTFRAYIKRDGTIADLKKLTFEQAAIVYRAQYWNKVRGDDLPAGVDYATFDFAVNSGPSRSAKFLQQLVGVEQDGEIGPITLAAVGKRDPGKLAAALCDKRLEWMQGLSKWRRYGKGWERRVREVKAHSLKLAATAGDSRSVTETKETGTDHMTPFLGMFAPKLIGLLTGKGMQSGLIGALIGALGLGASGGDAASVSPVGDIFKMDPSALLAAGAAVIGTIKRLLDKPDGPAETNVTPIAMPTEPLNIPIDETGQIVDTDAIAEAMQDCMNGKTVDDSNEDSAQLLAKMAGGRTLSIPDALRLGAVLFKRANPAK